MGRAVMTACETEERLEHARDPCRVVRPPGDGPAEPVEQDGPQTCEIEVVPAPFRLVDGVEQRFHPVELAICRRQTGQLRRGQKVGESRLRLDRWERLKIGIGSKRISSSSFVHGERHSKPLANRKCRSRRDRASGSPDAVRVAGRRCPGGRTGSTRPGGAHRAQASEIAVRGWTVGFGATLASTATAPCCEQGRTNGVVRNARATSSIYRSGWARSRMCWTASCGS